MFIEGLVYGVMPLSIIFQLYHDATVLLLEETVEPGENDRPFASR